jgi:hypothetical protein
MPRHAASLDQTSVQPTRSQLLGRPLHGMRKRGILAGGTESNSQHSTTRSPASTPPASDGAIECVAMRSSSRSGSDYRNQKRRPHPRALARRRAARRQQALGGFGSTDPSLVGSSRSSPRLTVPLSSGSKRGARDVRDERDRYKPTQISARDRRPNSCAQRRSSSERWLGSDSSVVRFGYLADVDPGRCSYANAEGRRVIRPGQKHKAQSPCAQPRTSDRAVWVTSEGSFPAVLRGSARAGQPARS